MSPLRARNMMMQVQARTEWTCGELQHAEDIRDEGLCSSLEGGALVAREVASAARAGLSRQACCQSCNQLLLSAGDKASPWS